MAEREESWIEKPRVWVPLGILLVVFATCFATREVGPQEPLFTTCGKAWRVDGGFMPETLLVFLHDNGKMDTKNNPLRLLGLTVDTVSTNRYTFNRKKVVFTIERVDDCKAPPSGDFFCR